MVGTSVAVVAFGAFAWLPATSVSADQVSSTQAQVKAVQAVALAGAARVRALTVAYEQASVRAAALGQQLGAEQAELASLRSDLGGTEASLRQEAIAGYVNDFTGVPAENLGQGPSDPAVRAEYVSLAAGDLTDAIDQYRALRDQVGSAEAAVATVEQASQAAAAAVNQVRLAALSQAASEQAQLDSLQGRLAQLVAAAAAAQQRQQHQRAAAPTEGLPVNNGIVAVVRSEVAASAPPAPARSPARATAAPTTAPPTTAPATTAPATTATATTAPAAPAVVAAPPISSVPAPTTTTTVASPSPPPAPTPAPTTTSGGGAGGVWLELRICESGDNYQENTGNGYYGAYQFSQQTWSGLGYPGRPDLEPPAMQDQAAMKLQADSGWGPWPACATALGLL
jgi:resuscitation-promoting factor RpfB